MRFGGKGTVGTKENARPAAVIRRAVWPAAAGLVALLGLSGFAPISVLAGPNQDGMLILDAVPSPGGTAGAAQCDWAPDLESATDAITEVDGDGKTVVIYVLAAFSDFSMPRIAGTAFGIEYTMSGQIPWDGHHVCNGGSDALNSDQSWPASGSGVEIVWPQDQPLDRQINTICWFECSAENSTTFKLVKNPNEHNAYFGDDSPAPVVDEISTDNLGMIGFGVEGYNPAATGGDGQDVTGACCNSNGQCIIRTKASCEATSDYTFLGANSSCFPNPCKPGMGACCIQGECHILPWDDCLSSGGSFMGQGSGCDPTPCNFDSIESSWGNLKNRYRRP